MVVARGNYSARFFIHFRFRHGANLSQRTHRICMARSRSGIDVAHDRWLWQSRGLSRRRLLAAHLHRFDWTALVSLLVRPGDQRRRSVPLISHRLSRPKQWFPAQHQLEGLNRPVLNLTKILLSFIRYTCQNAAKSVTITVGANRALRRGCRVAKSREACCRDVARPTCGYRTRTRNSRWSGAYFALATSFHFLRMRP